MATEISRQIDEKPSVQERPTEMQVLCLGLSRTGTMSIYTALNKLGYNCYHMAEVPKNKGNKHFWYWYEAMVIKFYSKGKPYGPAELDKVLENYSAVTDIPCILFSDELVAAYPKAKVILTNRDVDKWLASMEKLYTVQDWRLMRLLGRVEPDIAKYAEMLEITFRIWTAGDWQNRAKLREGYFKHYTHIRSIVPKDRLLEFRSEDGWAPLCGFLNKPIPDETYPHVNKGDNVVYLHRILLGVTILKVLAKGMIWASAIGAAIWAVWYSQKLTLATIRQ